MKRLLYLLALVHACLTSASFAQERVCEDFSVVEFREFAVLGREAIKEGALFKAFRLLKDTQAEMRCLDSLLHPDDVKHFAEMLAVVSLMDQDEEEARRWAQLRQFIGQGEEWQFLLPEGYVQFLAALPSADVGTHESGLARHPKKQLVTMNGKALVELRAPVEVPVFVQLVNRSGEAQRSYWQDGVRFDDQVSLGGGKAKLPNWAQNIVVEPPAAMGPVALGGQSDLTSVVSEKQKGWISKAEPAEWMPDCKWVGTPLNAARIGEYGIKINKWIYQLDNTADEVDLGADLKSCHEYRAIRRFEKWRASVKRAAAIGTVTDTDFNSLVRAFKQAANEVSADFYRDQFLRALNAPR